MPYQEELQVALKAANLASKRIMELWDTFKAVNNPPVTITTQADHDAQEIILTTLHQHYPTDSLRAEENTPALADAPSGGSRLWIIDPIDGTRGFAEKNGEFSVMIGLSVEGRVVLGVVMESALRRTTYAVKGQGCWVILDEGPPTPCKVSTRDSMQGLLITQSRSRSSEIRPHVEALKPSAIVESHSAGVKLARVARGEVDLFVYHYSSFNDWDICAGHILVEEAGGKVTDVRGQPVTYGAADPKQRKQLLASNGRLHELALERLRGIL